MDLINGTSMAWGGSMDIKIKEAIFRQVAREPFANKFDLKLVDLDEGYSKVATVFTPDMENIFGKAHGGALFALIDEAFETASNSHGTVAVALNMNISYLASPSTGATLTAEAKEINRTNKTAVYDIKVVEGEGHLLASCQALVYRLDKALPFLDQD
jgi:acyl-CoA thioesterase